MNKFYLIRIYRGLPYYIFFFHFLTFSRCYLFSVVISVYNTGRYLDESIGSLFNQTINFKKIQIILVNDGSTDNSEEICLKYQNMHPKNIFYIKIEHGGLSKARNAGINYAKGKYINFLDPDDKWDYRAFKYALIFFKLNKNIDFVAGRLKFFESDVNYHPLDYKFYKTRIVNLTEEYNCIHLSAASCFFKQSFIKNKKFVEGLLSGEDTRFINNYLLYNPIMGLLKEAIYYYRKRADATSIVQSQSQNIDFYFDIINNVEYYLINLSKSLYNKIVPFIQFLIGYNVLFRIKKSSTYKFLDKDNLEKYYNEIEQLLNQIEDKYILEQKILSNNYKLLALSKKYHRDLRYDIKFENNLFLYLGNVMINMKTEKNIIIWRILDIKDKILHLEGVDNFWLPRENYFYYCKLGNETFFPKDYYYCSNYDLTSMYGIIEKGRIVVFDIPFEIKNSAQIFEFYISYMNFTKEIYPSLGKFTHIPTITNGYYVSEKNIIKYINKRLTIFPYYKRLENKFEKLYCSELKNRQKFYFIKLRKKYIKRKNKHYNKHYKIWLINDRRDRAGDNGEYFFRYIKSKKLNGIKAYFTIEKNSSDYKRLKSFGNVLDIDSDRYLNKFLMGDKIITSISNSWVTNPFNEEQIYIRDLLHFDVIFLQHGIIKDDLSKYLNRFHTNYSKFVTSSKKEYRSILDTKYGYNSNNVILTGLPRYDNLESMKNNINIEKKIVIIPTWRMNIRGTRDSITYKSIHSDTFIYTEFFKFYNNLINDKNLHIVMKKNNYTGTFCLHPSLSTQYIDFNKNEFFSIIERCDYQKFLLESSLLITDYSSIFFDFGYLRKPVIYAHFDYKEYRSNHYPEGYFNYDKDGFGPVCHDINCTVNEIIFELENNCLLRLNYLRRTKKFFSFSDERNSERILKEIINNKNISTEDPKILIKTFIIIYISFIILYKFKYIIVYISN